MDLYLKLRFETPKWRNRLPKGADGVGVSFASADITEAIVRKTRNTNECNIKSGPSSSAILRSDNFVTMQILLAN